MDMRGRREEPILRGVSSDLSRVRARARTYTHTNFLKVILEQEH